jgi:ribose transport system substrate-binding protein/inositol transport system substrate-binding protein
VAGTFLYRINRVIYFIVSGLFVAILQTPAAATTIGVTMVPPIAFFQYLRDGIVAHAKQMAGVELQIAFAEPTEAAKQIAQVKSFIDSHVDAIIVLPADAAATGEITRMAQQAHIPLVYVNNGPREDWFDGKIALVLPNDLVAGRVQMVKLCALMGGKGNLAIIRGPSAHSAAALRTQGVKEVLANCPGVGVVKNEAADWDRKRAQDMVADWLASGVKIDAIAANNDEMAIGAAAALDGAKIPRGQILVGGVDATPDGLAAMQDNRITVTLVPGPRFRGQ